MSSVAESSPPPADDASLDAIKAQLVGSWKLVSAFNFENGSWVPAFGTPPSGLFIYGASGQASVQIMTVPPVSGVDPNTGPTPQQAQQIVNNYIAYYGAWSADATTVTVIPDGNLDPTSLGPENPQARPYQLKGDQLIIGDQKTYIRTLQRVL